MTLFEQWTADPNEKLLFCILQEIDFNEVLECIANEYNGADELHFFIDEDDTVFFIETYSNTSHNLPGYIGRLKCDKGDYDYLWAGYASFDDEKDLYLTTENEYLNRKDLRDLCIKDCCGYELEENLFNNLEHNAIQNII